MNPVNETCPWSGDPVGAEATTLYRGREVGFCNPGCRDKFAAAVSAFDAAIAARRSARSLRSLAGVPDEPPKLSDAALVVIDAQRAYQAGLLALPGLGAALERLAALLDAARAAEATVVHVAHRGGKGSPFDPAGEGFGFLAPATPAPGEAVVEKALPNAFAGTDLSAHIKNRPLILAGFMTHMCVSSTARAALDLGLACWVAEDACASRALPDPLGGGDLTAEEVHRAALAGLADRFAPALPAAAFIPR